MSGPGRPRGRRGYSLIEMLLVMSALTVILGLCVSLLYTLMKVDRSGRAQVTEAMTLDRLGRDFRHDVHAATKGETLIVKNDNVGGITLDLPDARVVEYRRSGTNVERLERGRNTPSRRELYRLPARDRATIKVKQLDGQAWAVIVLPVQPDPARLSPPHTALFTARIGKDHRLSPREEKAR